MGSDRSKAVYQAIIIPDDRISPDTIWEAQSSYTQQSPRVDQPIATVDSEMVLQATGELDAETNLEILTLRGGMPVSDGGAAFVWRHEGDTDYRGWDVPSVITGFEPIVWSNSGTIATYTPTVITLANQILVAACTYLVSGVKGVGYTASLSPGVWGGIYGIGAGPSPFNFHPCMTVLPSGRILMFHYSFEDTDLCQIRMQYSDSDGISWVTGAKNCLPLAIDISTASTGFIPGRLRCAHKDGQILLVAAMRSRDTARSYEDTFFQWASSDVGTSFSSVKDPSLSSPGAWDDTSGGNYHDIVVHDGKFYFFYLNQSDLKPAMRVLTSAYDDIQDDAIVQSPLMSEVPVCATAAGTTYISDGDLTATISDDGVMYCYLRLPAENRCIVVASNDSGDSWYMTGAGFTSGAMAYGTWWDGGDSTSPDGTYPRDFNATFQRGRVVLASNHASTPEAYDNSLAAIYLGGYSTVTMPSTSDWRRDLNQVTWGNTYLPFDTPLNVGWSRTYTGSISPAITTYADLSINTSTTSTLSYYRQPAGTTAEGIVARVVTVPIGGGWTEQNNNCIQLVTADSSHGWGVNIRFQRSGTDALISIHDMQSGTRIGSIITLTGYEGYIDVLVAVRGSGTVGKCNVWYRQYSIDSDRVWTLAAESTTLSDFSGVTYTTNSIRFGNPTATLSGTCVSRWREVHYVAGPYASASELIAPFYPTNLFPRQYSATPIYIENGVNLTAIDGPAFVNDSYTIGTTFEYPVASMHSAISPSPRTVWRSGIDHSSPPAQSIAWRLNYSSMATLTGGNTIGLYLGGINWRTGKLQRYYGGTWYDLATIDAATGLSGLSFTRYGDTVTPSTLAPAGSRYIQYDELAGYTIDFGGGQLARIKNNTAGVWTGTNTAGKTPTIFLENWYDSMDASYPVSGTDLSIWADSVLSIVHLTSTIPYFAGYRLVIDAQYTVGDYFQIGTMVLGPAVIFGTDTSLGKVLACEANVSLITSQDGSRRSRILGPPRRRVDVAWIDGTDMTQVQASNPSPDYLRNYTTANGKVIGSVADTPFQIMGAYQRLNGPHTPIVYAPYVQRALAENGTFTYTQPEKAMYCRMMSPVSLEHVIGDESVNEVYRIGTISFEEEV